VRSAADRAWRAELVAQHGFHILYGDRADLGLEQLARAEVAVKAVAVIGIAHALSLRHD
jgi:hypothetical protein